MPEFGQDPASDGGVFVYAVPQLASIQTRMDAIPIRTFVMAITSGRRLDR
jgi:hypothetical protein